MAKNNCLSKVRDISQLDQLGTEILEDLEDVIHALREIHEGDARKINEEFREILSNYVQRYEYESAAVVANTIKTNRLVNNLFQEGASVEDTTKRIRAWLEGDNSMEIKYNQKQAKYRNLLNDELIKEGKALNKDLRKLYRSGSMTKDIFRETYNIANGKPSLGGEVAAIARALKKVNNAIHDDLVMSGLNLGKRKDFLLSRFYDSTKLKELGKENFVEFMKKHIDYEKTFTKNFLIKNTDGETPLADRVLEQMFDDITKPRLLDAESKSGNSYMYKLRNRRLEFKDGANEFAVYEAFGDGKNFFESIDNHIKRNSKMAVNSFEMGTQPEMAWEAIKRKMVQEYKIEKGGKDHSLMKSLQKSYLNTVSRHDNATTQFMKYVENATSFMRAVSSLKLGSTVFTAAYDLNSTALQYAAATGKTQTEGYIKAISTFFKTALSEEHRRIITRALNTDVFFDDMGIAMGVHEGDMNTGHKMLNNFFKFYTKSTLVPLQTMLSRNTGSQLFASAFHEMVEKAGKGLELNPYQKANLKQFNLTEADLKFISDNADVDSRIGMYSSDSILDIDVNAFDENSLRGLRKREELWQKYTNYLDSKVRKGTPQPGAAQKRQLGKDVENDAIRTFLNLTMQFKETAFKILMSNKEVWDLAGEAGGRKAQLGYASEYLILGFVSWSAYEGLKSALFNTEGPWEKIEAGDFRSAFFDYLNKSSIAPLITDGIDQATSPYYGSSLKQFLAGPNIAMAEEALKIGRAKKPGDAARRWGMRHGFPSNHWAIKAVSRNLFEYDLIRNKEIPRN